MCGQDATVRGISRLRLGIQDTGAGPVAEQHAGAAVLPVEYPRKRLRPDHERALERTAAQKIVGRGEREHEARAYRLQIERRALVDAELVLHGDRGCGK